MKHRIRSRLASTAFVSFFTASVVLAQSQPLYSISGEVRDEFGRIAPSVKVCASPKTTVQPRTAYCVETDENGRYLLRLAKGGTYELSADKVSDGYMPQTRSFYQQSPASVQELTLNEDSPKSYVSISLGPKSGAITGKVLDNSTGLPVENIVITMCHAENPKACFSISAKNAEGVFKVFGSTVPFTFKIAADGYEDWIGLTGQERAGKGITLASGTTMQLDVYLRRRKEMRDEAISEAEKQAYIHLPAPKQLSPADEAVFNHYPRATRVEWSEVEGAARYMIEVDYCKGLRTANAGRECIDPQPLKQKVETTETSYEFLFVGAQPGRWRVWAVDKEGRAGFKSPWRMFFYRR